MGEGCRWGRREWEWGLGEHRLLVHARHSSGVVSIACSVITSLWKHAQSHTLLASWKAATRGKLLGRCQRQMGLHPDLHLGLLWAAVVIYLFIFFQKNEWVKCVEELQTRCTSCTQWQPQKQSPAVWESGSLIYAAIHLLSRIWAGWVTIAAKQTLARGHSGVIQMYTCEDGGQPSHAEVFMNVAYREWIPVILPLHAAFHCSSQMSSLSSLTPASQKKQVLLVWELSPHPPTPPRPSLLCLLGWLAKSWRIVCRCAWREASPLCPGRTCGLGVFTLALFQAVFPHSMLASVSPGWQCSNPPHTHTHKRGHSQVEVTPAIMFIHPVDTRETQI